MKRIETKFHVRLPFTCIYEPESHAVSTDCALSAAHDGDIHRMGSYKTFDPLVVIEKICKNSLFAMLLEVLICIPACRGS